MNEHAYASAAAAGRLVVALLFAANAIAYLHEPVAITAFGMAASIIAAALGYFAASAAAFGEDGRTILAASIVASVVSGACFLAGTVLLIAVQAAINGGP